MSQDGPATGDERGPGVPGAEAGPGAGLLGELKRRGVTRAVMAYAVAAFAALQVAEPILHALRLPDGWLTGVVLLLAGGFPVVAAISWGWDLTRRGWVRADEAAPAEDAPAASARAGASRGTLAAVVVGSALLGAGLAWLALRQTTLPVAADADGRISVAVADFANQTGEPPLDALSGLLITSLEQSRKLKVLTRGRMFELLEQAGHERVERVDEPLARELGAKAGVRALLLASVVRLGGSYQVELRALDPVKDHYLFTLREQAADQAGLLPLVDRLSEAVRLALHAAPARDGSQEIEVARAITPNLEAYRHYFKGKELRARLDDHGARAEFEKALTLEPRFALAHLELAFISALWLTGETELRAEAAAAGAAQLPEKERETVLAYADELAGRSREAEARALRLAARYPDESEVVYHAAQLAQRPLQSYELMRRVVRLAPDHEQAWTYAALAATKLGRAGEVLDDALARERVRPTAGMATAVGMARLGTGAAAAAAADFRRALERGGTILAPMGLGFSLLALGDLATIRSLLEADPDGGTGNQFGHVILEARQGKLKASSARLARLGTPGLPGRAWLLATMEAERGHHAEAEALLGRLDACQTIGAAGARDLWLHAGARIHRAASLGVLGRGAEGRALVERQLRDWKDADPDLPLLAEARAVCRQLGCMAT